MSSLSVFTGERISVRQCIELVHQHLDGHQLYFGHGTDNAWDEACWLVEGILAREEGQSFTEQSLLTPEQLQEIEGLLHRRVNERQPLAYLLGEAWFAGLPFAVDDRVLIPRSPIAELIGNQFHSLLKAPPKRILDLCTGSGCIGIACAMAFPEAVVDITDLSEGALEVANLNISKHKLGHRVNAIASDLFSNITERYDLIISNPPYVSKEEYDELPEEYLQEPEMGLVSAAEGLALPLQILSEAGQYLQEDGILLLELGYSWQALADHLPELPMLWLDFEYGGEGVCMLTLEQLSKHKV